VICIPADSAVIAITAGVLALAESVEHFAGAPVLAVGTCERLSFPQIAHDTSPAVKLPICRKEHVIKIEHDVSLFEISFILQS
jgi:hypothetical protein